MHFDILDHLYEMRKASFKPDPEKALLVLNQISALSFTLGDDPEKFLDKIDQLAYELTFYTAVEGSETDMRNWLISSISEDSPLFPWAVIKSTETEVRWDKIRTEFLAATSWITNVQRKRTPEKQERIQMKVTLAQGVDPASITSAELFYAISKANPGLKICTIHNTFGHHTNSCSKRHKK